MPKYSHLMLFAQVSGTVRSALRRREPRPTVGAPRLQGSFGDDAARVERAYPVPDYPTPALAPGLGGAGANIVARLAMLSDEHRRWSLDLVSNSACR